VRYADEAYVAGKEGVSWVGKKAGEGWDAAKRWVTGSDETTDAAKTLDNLPCANSFSGGTLVMTASGAKPIAELVEGEIVLAYNEETGEVGAYPITDTISHVDATIVLLTIDGETLETTPDHPFYVMDTAPWLMVGEIAGHWVEVDELQIGDEIRKADGSTGVVRAIKIVLQPQRMYNLTVAEAHTFFVGHGQWLAHNCRVNFQPLGGFSRDVLTKGFHVNSDVGELSLLPRRLNDGTIEIAVRAAGANTGSITNKVVQGVTDLLSKDPRGAIQRAQAIVSNFGHDSRYANRVAEARLLLEALTNGGYKVVK
jgi:hypothetical protein